MFYFFSFLFFLSTNFTKLCSDNPQFNSFNRIRERSTVTSNGANSFAANLSESPNAKQSSFQLKRKCISVQRLQSSGYTFWIKLDWVWGNINVTYSTYITSSQCSGKPNRQSSTWRWTSSQFDKLKAILEFVESNDLGSHIWGVLFSGSFFHHHTFSDEMILISTCFDVHWKLGFYTSGGHFDCQLTPQPYSLAH